MTKIRKFINWKKLKNYIPSFLFEDGSFYTIRWLLFFLFSSFFLFVIIYFYGLKLNRAFHEPRPAVMENVLPES